MTTALERLTAAAEAGDAATIRDVVAPLSEEERRALASVARDLVADAKRREIYGDDLAPAAYATYGLLGVSELRSLAWRARHLPPDIDVVLRRRAPERLQPIVTFLLAEVDDRAWRAVRVLVRDGVIPAPSSQAYTVGMLSATRYHDPADLIAADPGLVDDEIWRLFEVEGGGEDSLANHEKFFGDRWGTWFRASAAADPAVRERLLDVSLAAIARDFSAYRAGWFSRFHESLQPTDAERAGRGDAYLALLRSRIGPTVTFAVRALERVRRAGALDAERLLDLVGPVLADAPASTASAAVTLLGRCGGPPDRAATVLLEALAHGSADVHGAALGAIDRLVPGSDADLAQALRARLGDVAASRRKSAVALVERFGGSDAGSVAASDRTLPQVRPASRPTDPLDPSRALVPITTVEELVERMAALLENAESPDDLEGVLDGVSRLCDHRADDFDRLARPVARRARNLLGQRTPFSGHDPTADICCLAIAWIERETPPALDVADPIIPVVGVGAFLAARTHELALRVSTSNAGSLLSTPTHRGGWIAPMTLVERLRTTGGVAPRFDLVAALLRIGSSGRDDALRAATGLSGEPASAIRYALGGNETIGSTAGWWIAAARVRSPSTDDEAVERRHPRHGPDAGRAARVELGPEVEPAEGERRVSAFHVEPRLVRPIALDEPTVQQVAVHERWPVLAGDLALARWIDTVRPGYREPRAAVAAHQVGVNVDWWTAQWQERVPLEPYLDPWTPLGPMARLLVGTALGQREPGERGLAVDVIIAAVEDGRLDGAGLADGLTRTAERLVDRPRRWAIALDEVGSASASHAAVVREAIARTLPILVDRRPADIIDLLRLLQESTAEAEATVDPVARDALASLATSGGRIGRIARGLLPLVPPPVSRDSVSSP
jgi:hypothetical protein